MTEIEHFLRKQNVTFHIFIIEQSLNGAFNRAKLFNVGFNESRLISNFSCYIFHDVDMLPMSPDNHYHCGDSPIHMAVAVEKFGFKLPYNDYAGGVLAMTGEQFQRINGFPNLYYGWGGEDDDIVLRIRSAGFQLIRPSIVVGKYKSLDHKQAEESPGRLNLLENASSRIATDGINSLNYTLLSRTIEGTKVHIIADVGST
ncbi:beta-1,4-galactosyltransferase 3-like [Dreissena polymorpha]|uniref:beta-1,4-galactosyltransferase 3-like n=1 Tax=Dreissena polymorpha TaxID=45954 RepID=UPI002263F3B4|nr:beta-1,4-galactosyltransferase 3-like [Dreissena polymorpha]